jgi:hypothetical protein
MKKKYTSHFDMDKSLSICQSQIIAKVISDSKYTITSMFSAITSKFSARCHMEHHMTKLRVDCTSNQHSLSSLIYEAYKQIAQPSSQTRLTYVLGIKPVLTVPALCKASMPSMQTLQSKRNAKTWKIMENCHSEVPHQHTK